MFVHQILLLTCFTQGEVNMEETTDEKKNAQQKTIVG